MDINAAINYPKKDPQWITKILIFALHILGGCLIVPFFAMIGYTLEIVRRVSSGDDATLPDWGNWGQKCIDGLKLFGIMLVYEIPIFLITGIATAITIAMAAAGGEDGAVGGVGAVVMLLTQGISMLWGLVIFILTPMIMIALARTGQFGAAFKFGEMFGMIMKNLGNYIIACLLFIAFILVAEIVGLLACFIGLFFTVPYAYMAVAHLLGQLSRQLYPTSDYSGQ